MRKISHNGGPGDFDRTPGAVGVNRQLDLSRVAVVGLDLDHTLAMYRDHAVNDKALVETCLNLVRFKSYPRSVADIRYASSDVARGLVLDTKTGHVLKLDGAHRFLRAFYAGRWLGRDTVRSRYGSTGLEPRPPRFTTIDSAFDLPCVSLFARYPTSRSSTGAAGVDYGVLHADVREMLDRTHVTGSLKRWIIANVASVVAPASALLEPLRRIRSAGKKTFLLTNSDHGYTSALLDYLFEAPGPAEVWRELFDAVVVNADKPRFFSRSTPLSAIDCAERPRVFRGGCAAALEQHFGVSGGQTLYIGDNPVADCAPARRRLWRTGLVVPELTRISSPPTSPPSKRGETRFEGWGDALWEEGELTRLGRFVREIPDVFAADAANLLAAWPDGRFA